MPVQIRSCSSKRVLPCGMASVVFYPIVLFDANRLATQCSSRHTLRALHLRYRRDAATVVG
jgi:hypothetical protein